jgi:dTDP-4-dehydrorhamnose 3,5-epimerase
MPTKLTTQELNPKISSDVYLQKYESQEVLDGVRVVPLKNNIGEEGDFCEVMRITDNGMLESLPEFKLAQINRTYLFSNSIKAWHLHLGQDEIWYVSPSEHLFVGLWDLRAKSPTTNKTMRLVLGGGSSSLLYIPRGVAHGSANFSQKEVNLFYFTNAKFNLESPDERRLPWDSIPNFWSPERD